MAHIGMGTNRLTDNQTKTLKYKMEINNQDAPTFTLISIVCSIISWISIMQAQYVLSFAVSIIALISGIFAIRYYYYAGNYKRNQLKQHKDGNNNKEVVSE